MATPTPFPTHAAPKAPEADGPAQPGPRQRQHGDPPGCHPTREEPEPVNERDLPSHGGRDEASAIASRSKARQATTRHRQAGPSLHPR